MNTVGRSFLGLVSAGLCLAVVGCPSSPEPALSVSSESVSLDGADSTATFEVWNSGEDGSTLAFSVSADSEWLAVNPTSGTSNGAGDQRTVTVAVDNAELPKATFTGTVTVTSDVGTAQVHVTLTTVDPTGPTAAFSAEPTSGEAPLTVEFTDMSDSGTASITGWAWDFGDGGTSTEQNPSHTYDSEGTYTVELTVTTSVGSDTETKTGYIAVNPQPVGPTADFTAGPTSGEAPLTVDFTDMSDSGTEDITQWAWDFGDGGTSTDQNPSHTYDSEGTYTVELTVTTSVGSDTATQTDVITVDPEPVGPTAAFSANPTEGETPLTVDFMDMSDSGTEAITEWAWEFGDGGTSTEQNPSHTYESEGTFDVSLTVTTSVGSSTEVKSGYITVALPALQADFMVSRTDGSTPLLVQFDDVSDTAESDPVMTWYWKFGDGSTSTSSAPIHTYEVPGSYTPTLTVTTVSGRSETVAYDGAIEVASGVDSDGDGVSDADELEMGTDPDQWDSDGDTFGDGDEIVNGTDPLNPSGSVSANTIPLNSIEDLEILGLDGDTLVLFYSGPANKTPLISEGASLVTASTIPSVSTEKGAKGLFDSSAGFIGEVTDVVSTAVAEGQEITVDGVTYAAEAVHDGVVYTVSVITKPIVEVFPDMEAEWSKGVSFNTNDPGLFPGGSPLRNKEIYNENGLTLTIREGTIAFSPQLSLYIHTADGELVETKVIADGAFYISLDLEANANLAQDFDSGDIPLVQAPIPIPNLPLKLDLELGGRVEASIEANGQASAGFDSRTQVTVGGRYHMDEMNNISSLELDNNLHTPRLEFVEGNASVKVFVKPRVDINMYGQAGAYLEFRPFAHLDVSIPCPPVPDFEVGIDSEVGVYSSFFGLAEANASAVRPPEPRRYSFDTPDSCGLLGAAPSAEFSADATSGTAPLEVTFTDHSTPGSAPDITARQWSFGDGASSQGEQPTHTYAEPGMYTVSLTVESASGTDTLTRTGMIEVTGGASPPVADFTATPRSGAAPLAVDFTNLAQPGTSPITLDGWDFDGDGAVDSNAQHPSSTYTEPGTYSVTLRVQTEDGTDGETKHAYIRVLEDDPGGGSGLLAGDWHAPSGSTDFCGYLGWLGVNETREQEGRNPYHLAVDMCMDTGDPVYAIGDGEVLLSSSTVGGYGVNGVDGNDGGAVVIRHQAADGTWFTALYGHLYSPIALGPVNAGDIIGYANNFIPPHVHFGIHLGREPSSPKPYRGYSESESNTYGFVDPIQFLADHPSGDPGGDVTPGEMLSVPAGSFDMGDPFDEGDSDELPVHTVSLSAYAIGKFEVTNQEYADVLNWALANGRLETASSSTASAFGRQLLDVDDPPCQITYTGTEFVVDTRDGFSMADHPVVEVSWYGAAAYCNWLSEIEGLEPCYDTATWECDFGASGYHLPTEAQWERAAAWTGSTHLRYGNGSDSISSSSVNYSQNNPLGLSDWPYTSPVGYYNGANGTVNSPSPIGAYDMSGNVWEWCNDWYDSDYYDSSPGTDPTGPESGSLRVLRGGNWTGRATTCRSADRVGSYPGNALNIYGFRLAR